MNTCEAGPPLPEGERWSWFVGTQLIETSPVSPLYIYNRSYLPQNQLFICNQCGEIWARIFRPSATSWHIDSRPCERHGGGFLLPYDPQWITIAPTSILRREVLLISELADPSTYDLKLIFRNTL